MKNDQILSEVFPDAKMRQALQHIVSSVSDFATTAKNAGLDPSYDFQNSNLTKVDFSYSDLRGFNFSGSDLSYSYGIDILLDDTTTFTGASLLASPFKTVEDERLLFSSSTKIPKIYAMLKSGDPYDVSNWIASRSGSLGKNHLKNLDDSQAAILCRKLVTDNIDLTKRTTLFYHIKDFASSEQEVRSVVADFLAFHLDNPAVVRGFIRVAGDLLSQHPFVAKTILMLCEHRDPSIREIAFNAICSTSVFHKHFGKIREAYFRPENTDLRKREIFEVAWKMGRSHVLAINTEGRHDDISPDNILDYEDIVLEAKVRQVQASQARRNRWQNDTEIVHRQQEVLVSCPLLGKILERRGVNWLDRAKLRASGRFENLHDYLASKIDHGFKRQR